MKIKAFTKLFQSFSASLLLIFLFAQPCLADPYSIAQDAFSVQPKQETKEPSPKGYAFPIIWDLSNPMIVGSIYLYCLKSSIVDKTGCIGYTILFDSIPYSFWNLPSDYYTESPGSKKIWTPIMKFLINGAIGLWIAGTKIDCGLTETDSGAEKGCNAKERTKFPIWFGTIAGISVIEAIYHGFKVHEYNENLEKEKSKRLTLIPIPTKNGVGVGLSMNF